MCGFGLSNDILIFEWYMENGRVVACLGCKSHFIENCINISRAVIAFIKMLSLLAS